MANRRNTMLLILMIAFVGFTQAQSRKTIKEKGIKSQTVKEYFIEEGMDEPVVEMEETYNKDGEVIELKEYNPKGEVKKWEKYVYNEERYLIKEIFLDEKGRITRTEQSIYKDGLRMKKHFYNNRGKMYKKKEYVYEYRK